uniref:NAC transcription factor 082 n=1 Tax=Jatropha curcas TaxID=180498 RepID=R4N7T1_JATCU|nr:NAC transcription factor 082 [Jatropha curcas]
MAERSELPCGYRFVPTDEELVNFYLRRKVEKQPLPRGVVRTRDIYSKNPWEIFDKSCNGFFYVFTTLRKKQNSRTRFDRTAGSGTWKNRFSKSFPGDDGKSFWFKKDYVFELNKNQSSADSSIDNGHWIMQEFSLEDEGSNSYVLCKISNKNARDSQKEKKEIVEPKRHSNERKFSSDDKEDQNPKRMRINSHCLFPPSDGNVKPQTSIPDADSLEAVLGKFWVPKEDSNKIFNSSMSLF